MESDRICGLQINLMDCTLSILCVYLPCTDHDIEEYKYYLNELDCTIGALQSEGPVIVAGDFNAHLPTLNSITNTQGRLLSDLINHNSLYPVSCSSIATGPKYTYFSGQTTTTVDYILISSDLASHVSSCEILAQAPLNLFDHLPITTSICVQNLKHVQCQPTTTKINWSKASKDGSVHLYSSKVQHAITPLLHTDLLSISEVDTEIRHVAEILTNVAQVCLPHIKPKKKKKFIIDSDLSSLCKQSKAAWKCWKDAGRPSSGELWSAMKEARRAVKRQITACRARRERSDIQKRDLLFKNNSNHRF